MKLKDLEGWKYVDSVQSSMNISQGGEGYGIFLSPDETKIGTVDMNNEDVIMIWDKPGLKFEYLHPMTEKGMNLIDINPEHLTKNSLFDLENILRSAKKNFNRRYTP